MVERMTTDEDGPVCEQCDVRTTWEESARTEDGCYLGLSCWTAWRAEFDACAHSWERRENEWGEPAHICRRCSGIVDDESWPALFPGQPLPAVAAASDA